MPYQLSDGHVRQFMSIFTGYERAHGRYDVVADPISTKQKGTANTIPLPVTEEAFRYHLRGSGPGVGIVPLTEANTCWFGALDIDIYENFNLQELLQKIRQHGLKLIPCRTKSGGVHLYAFFKEPMSGVLVQSKLQEWVSILRLSSKTEIFPKQAKRQGEDDIGNWINLPYYDCEAGTQRYMYTSTGGAALNIQAFFDNVEKNRISLGELSLPIYKTHAPEDPLWEAPPCLIALVDQGGVRTGGRNNTLLSAGVYLLRRFGQDPDFNLMEKLEEYNQLLCGDDLLPDREVQEIHRSLLKKNYFYMCKASPLVDVCQKRVCLTRKFGIGDPTFKEDPVHEFLNLTKYAADNEDPAWAFELMGERIMVDHTTFYQRDLLNRAVMARINCIPVQFTQAKWLTYLSKLIITADVVPMPPETSETAQIWEFIQYWLESTPRGVQRDELMSGRIWYHDGRLYFRQVDLLQYLKNRRIIIGQRQLASILKTNHVEVRALKIAKKSVNVWSLMFDEYEKGVITEKEIL